MTNKEWIIETLAHRPTSQVPFNMTFSPPQTAALQEHFKTEDISSAIGLPIHSDGPTSIKSLYASPKIYGSSVKDEFGVIWSTSEIDRGSPLKPVLDEPELSNYVWPNADDNNRFEHFGAFCTENKDNFTMLWIGDLWERATFMRGMEHILLDVALNPIFVADLLEGIKDFILDGMKIMFERFEFDCVAISDDYGTQNTMVMSPKSWKTLVKPRLKEIYTFAKQNNRYVFHHSCGNILPIISEMIDIGLDVLHPIQPEAMNIEIIKREFGKDITLCGGLNTQQLLPTGTPGDIRAEVKRLKETMGGGSGYILEPGITIQADVPFENVLALIDICKDQSNQK